jgi:hypothetical protein
MYVHCSRGASVSWTNLNKMLGIMDAVEKEANKKYDQMSTCYKEEIQKNVVVRRMVNEFEDSICYCYTKVCIQGCLHGCTQAFYI